MKSIKTLSALCAFTICIIILQGCSDFEPKTGTKVVFTFPNNKPVSREKLAAVSRYLIARGEQVLGVRAPRVDKVTDRSLVLLLPGKTVSRKEAEQFIQSASIELYHLTSVATKNHPDRPWKIKAPSTRNGPYLFTGPNARQIDSQKDPWGLMKSVVGYPNTKPILTGGDVLPTASFRQAGNGWAVLLQFNDKGAETFRKFTNDNPGEYLAVFYNNRLLTAPLIQGEIKGGKVFITGFNTESQARAVMSDLNAGKIPVKVSIKYVQRY